MIGEYKNHKYYIVKRNASTYDEQIVMEWYCAYVEVDRNYFKDLDELDVHGGITFSGEIDGHGYVIGWDYNHSVDLDFDNANFPFGSNKWINNKDGIKLIEQEIKDFIERYL